MFFLEPIVKLLNEGVPPSQEGIEQLSNEIKSVEGNLRKKAEAPSELLKEYQIFGILSSLLYLRLHVDQNERIITLLEEIKEAKSSQE